MPKRDDIKKILIIGSGPIVIGQAAEFDYSGTQAIKALKSEGYEVVLVNSNPATIMTDPEFADRTYIEPLSVEYLEEIIKKERPDALLPTLGGQTGLNLAVELAESGVLDRYSVELIGAKFEAIKKAEDRELFKKTMEDAGLPVPKGGFARSMEEARRIAGEIGFPVIIRPSFTLGGTGGGVAYNWEEFEFIASRGLDYSPITEILIEESVLGWKEFELEVMRDKNDNVVIVCPIENFDPMGVHTGDSITVAPTQTLTDEEYQLLRDYAIRVIRAIGVETGGSNIQFAVNPDNGRVVVIEMNPRVSRSSALASKATGFPIAKIAAKLAIGYTLDEIPNDITKETPASFEPTIDYVVVKIPHFTFEKFPEADPVLTTQMKSVGEVMAIGRNFKEAFQKALRSLEKKYTGLDKRFENLSPEDLEWGLVFPNAERVFYLKEAFLRGYSIEKLYDLTKIDPWFLDQVRQIVEKEREISNKTYFTFDELKEIKSYGFSDAQLSDLWRGKKVTLENDGVEVSREINSEDDVRNLRHSVELRPTFKLVDTCAAEFEAYTPYFYSAYEFENEGRYDDVRKVMILGAGPNRIGQGIEFDYCCVHAVFALKEMGIQTIMVNSNPETVSTDYDTADHLYFEPLTLEDVLEIYQFEKPEGVILQLGGQTPLKLSVPLSRNGVNVLGTSSESIDMAEDREKFRQLLMKLGLKQPPSGTAYSVEDALKIARDLGFPVLVRPSYVLGGRAMNIAYDEEEFLDFIKEAIDVNPEHPVLIDKFLEDAIEVDVDALSDSIDVYIGGILEHIEEAGVHSGDSANVIPPRTLPEEIIRNLEEATKSLALELKVKGLINVQYAIKDSQIYVLEVNPRASRTVPFISKATGVPLAKVATRIMMGQSLREALAPYGVGDDLKTKYGKHIAVKEVVLPFSKFPGVDPVLGPEMKSTGEVMGLGFSFGEAFAKAQIAAGNPLPVEGNVFLSIADRDKPKLVDVARGLKELGFELYATRGTCEFLKKHGVEASLVYKVGEGRPDVIDHIKNGQFSLIINTPGGSKSRKDGKKIRVEATRFKVPIITTVPGARAALEGIKFLRSGKRNVAPLQELLSERS